MNSVETINHVSVYWVEFIGNKVIESTLFFLIITAIWLLIRKKVSSQLGYCLFFLILVKIILPIPFTITLPANNVFPEQFVLHEFVHPISLSDRNLSHSNQVYNTSKQSSKDSDDQLIVSSNQSEKTAGSLQSMKSNTLHISPYSYLMFVWMGIVLFLFLRFLVLQWKTHKKLQDATSLDHHSITNELNKIQTIIGIKREIRWLSCPWITAPVVWGILRPSIIIPTQFHNNLSQQQIRWILLHELTHVKRYDNLFSLFQGVMQILFFFHPITWITNRMIDQQREYACDDVALTLCSASRKECGKGLLSIAQQVNGLPLIMSTSVGFLKSRSLIRRRMMRILDADRKLQYGLSKKGIAVLALCVFLSLLSFQSIDISTAATNERETSKIFPKEIVFPKNVVLRHVDTAKSYFQWGRRGAFDKIVYKDWNLFLRNPENGEILYQLTKHKHEYPESWINFGQSVLSNDGEKLAFVAIDRTNNIREIRLINIDGTDERVIYSEEFTASKFFHNFILNDWSPDDSQIAFSIGDQPIFVNLLSVADGTVRTVKKIDPAMLKPYSICFSPDGKYLAYDHADGRSSIHVVPIDGGEDIIIADSQAKEVLLGWAPNRNWIVYASDMSGTMDIYAIYFENGEVQGNPRLIKKNIGYCLHTIGFENNDSLYYCDAHTYSEIYVADIESTKTPTQIYIGSSNGKIHWSPDGDSLAFLITPSRRRTISLWNPLDQTFREITLPRGRFEDMHWFPGGKKFLVWGHGFGHCIFNAETSELKKINKKDRIGAIAILPNGKSMFSIRFDYISKKGNFVITDFDNTSLFNQEIKEASIDNENFSISPDGKMMAYYAVEDKDKWIWSLKILNLEDGSTRHVIDTYEGWRWFDPYWTSDAKHIVYVAGMDLMRISINAESPRPEKIYEFDTKPDFVSLHPDGRRIAYVTDWKHNIEVWSLENFLPEN